MTHFGQLNNFNTGCFYSKEGQPITWACFEDALNTGIIFHDHARGITRAIPMPGVEGHTKYQGLIKPCTVHGNINDAYVRECERLGVSNNELPGWLGSIGDEFRELTKFTEKVIIEARGI